MEYYLRIYQGWMQQNSAHSWYALCKLHNYPELMFSHNSSLFEGNRKYNLIKQNSNKNIPYREEGS